MIRRSPRIVRLTSPKGDGGRPVYRALSIMNDRFAAYVHGNDLRVNDLEGDEPTRPMFVVERGYNFATATNTLVIYDEEHGFRRFVFEGDRFVLAAQFVLSERPHPWPSDPVLSPSGKYLAVEVPALPGETSSRVMLLDAVNGHVLSSHPCTLSARASFAYLDGAEVLFLSAPCYMSVLFIDCASGRTLHTFESTTSWDFCHTDYELSADGTRLLAFGCIWAAPYEARLYDATPWTRNGLVANEGFPLPLRYRQNEDLEYETVFTPRFTKTTDGLLDVNGSVSLRELRCLDAAGLEELREGLSELNTAILHAALALEGDTALLQRRVDPVSGQVVATSIKAAQSTSESHVHALPEHQVLIVGKTIEWFDGHDLHDVGTLVDSQQYFCSAVTSDGGTIVVRELER